MSEYGETFKEFPHGDKLQWRTRIRARSPSEVEGKRVMRAERRSKRSTVPDHRRQWLVQKKEGDGEHPPQRLLQCGSGISRPERTVEYLFVDSDDEDERRGDETAQLGTRPALQCEGAHKIGSTPTVWIDPLRNKIYPDKRLGEKLDTREIRLKDGGAYNVSYRELELFLMGGTREEFTKKKQELKKKRASFDEMVAFYNRLGDRRAENRGVFALGTLTENARVVRAKVDGTWKSKSWGVTTVEEDSGRDTERIVEVGAGGERRRLKNAKPKYIARADERRNAARAGLESSLLLSRTAFRAFSDAVCGGECNIDEEAYEPLQEAFESYLIHLFFGVNRLARDDRRVTVLARDLFNAMKGSEPKRVQGRKNEKRVLGKDNRLLDSRPATAAQAKLLLTDSKIKNLAAVADVHRVGDNFLHMVRLVADNSGKNAWFRTLCGKATVPSGGAVQRIITGPPAVHRAMRDEMRWEMPR